VSDYQTYSKSSRFLIICKTIHLICTGIKGILLQEQEMEHKGKIEKAKMVISYASNSLTSDNFPAVSVNLNWRAKYWHKHILNG
jgi:hypothetical protein